MKLIQFKSSLLPHWGIKSEESFNFLQKELDQMVQSFFGPYKSVSPHIYDFNLHPEVEMEEDKDRYFLKCRLENLSEDVLEVSTRNNILTIKGFKREGSEKKGMGYTHDVRYFGPFWRDIYFESEIHEDRIIAIYDKGTLMIEVPKRNKILSPKKVIPLLNKEEDESQCLSILDGTPYG